MSAARQARRERREAERKAKKAETRRIKAEGPAELPLEAEFSPELVTEANAVRERVHQRTRIPLSSEDGFVSQTAAASPNRAEINRANAQHATGPTSPSGKLASSRNSLKHGLASGTLLIPGEDPAAFESLLRGLLEEHQPAGTTEDLLVREMAQSFWLAQRAVGLQTGCFTADGVNEKSLALYLRYQTTQDRAFHKALNTLIRLKRNRIKVTRTVPAVCVAPEPGFVSQSATSSHERGFVSQNDPASAANDQFVSQNEPSDASEIETSLSEAA